MCGNNIVFITNAVTIICNQKSRDIVATFYKINISPKMYDKSITITGGTEDDC